MVQFENKIGRQLAFVLNNSISKAETSSGRYYTFSGLLDNNLEKLEKDIEKNNSERIQYLSDLIRDVSARGEVSECKQNPQSTADQVELTRVLLSNLNGAEETKEQIISRIKDLNQNIPEEYTESIAKIVREKNKHTPIPEEYAGDISKFISSQIAKENSKRTPAGGIVF